MDAFGIASFCALLVMFVASLFIAFHYWNERRRRKHFSMLHQLGTTGLEAAPLMKRFAENCAPRVAATQRNYGVGRPRPCRGQTRLSPRVATN